MSLIVFAGIDQVFSTIDESDYQNITKLIQDLQEQNAPLILLSNKTRAEVTDWLEKFNLICPFIVEQGSGIFIPQNELRFTTTKASSIDNYHLYQLGCSYTEARAALKVVQEEINKVLRGFGDLDEENIPALIDGSMEEARKAKAREFSEYFLTPSRLDMKQLQEVAVEYGFRIVPGDKLSLILSAKADVATAINWLKQSYQTTEHFHTMGLGSTEQDLAWLETVDIPVIIATDEGVNPCFADKDWQVADNPGVEGWAESIVDICLHCL